MHTSIKTLVSKTSLYNNYLTILIILIILEEHLLELYIKSTILMFNLQNWDFSLKILQLNNLMFTSIVFNY